MAKVWNGVDRWQPYEHMALALHEAECIPSGFWEQHVTNRSMDARMTNYRWCDHEKDHNTQAAAIFSSLYLQKRA